MKKNLIIALMLFCVLQSVLFAEDEKLENVKTESVKEKTALTKAEKLEIASHKFFISYTEGVVASTVTRIIKQEGRTNFVWNDYLLGIYLESQTNNIPYVNYLLRLAAFYPYHYTFNDVEQKAKQTILYAGDVFAAPYWSLKVGTLSTLTLAPGIHYYYQLKDKFHYSHLGLGLKAGLDFPIMKTVTLVLDGMFSYDYGNLGSNHRMQPVDFAWQYQVSFGVRVSKKRKNTTPYFSKKENSSVEEN